METTKLRRFAQYARRTLLELIEARLQLVLMPNSAARRENLSAVKQLEQQIQDHSREQVIDRVAYTWFNRFCALRYMDVNRVNRISVVSPLDGQFQPEILAEAKMGHIDEEMVPAAVQAKVRALLDGTAPSQDPQQEAYRLLVVAVCNYWQPAMPFLFERIADYTELLMPDDLLSGNSILAYTREAMTPDACQDVEVIGWLYQFYISEKKDAVFEGLKKNKKITPENIPAATQLFTPHWIVRYLVENSLGRLWLLNRPNSRLAEKMPYYIKAVTSDEWRVTSESNAGFGSTNHSPLATSHSKDFLRIAKPEDIKLCDPACGSGHMLTYAFDLLYAIYEEEGADPAEIPSMILAHNLFGIEIDERAAELAAFALTMKALQYDKRFFRRSSVRGEPAEPHICVLRPVKIEPHDLDAYVAEVGRDLFTANLRTLLTQFEEADNFGSLIRPVAMDYTELRRVLAEKGIGSQLLLEHVHKDVLRVLDQAEYLSQRYQVVVANPPYMGSNGMNVILRNYLSENYPDAKADLMTCFMERMPMMLLPHGFWSMINLPSWMFLDSFEMLRKKLVATQSIKSLLHLGRGVFGSDFGSVAFVVQLKEPGYQESGHYRRLFDRHVEVRSVETIRERYLDSRYGKYEFVQNNFNHIPGSTIAYWTPPSALEIFRKSRALGEQFIAKSGVMTGDDNFFLKYWYETALKRIGFNYQSEEKISSEHIYFPMNKEEGYRKWIGRFTTVFRYVDHGAEHAARNDINYRLRDKNLYFKSGISWGDVTSGPISFRYQNPGLIFAARAPTIFSDDKSLLGFLNSNLTSYFGGIINPTLSFNLVDLYQLPLLSDKLDVCRNKIESCVNSLLDMSGRDWNAMESSWDFSSLPLLHPDYRQLTLKATYHRLRAHWGKMTLEMQRLEHENNRIFIEAYGLQDELTPDVPLKEITLTCNPHYRYGGYKSEPELEYLLCADTMREFISYAVGCMFGRYSLDKPGLILANQGETLEDYNKIIVHEKHETHEQTEKGGDENFRAFRAFRGLSLFAPDDDNVIPLLDGDWFTDDITGRFREFLRVTFGDEHYEENLRFIEEALGKKGKPLAIRDYFLKEFYTDHVKRYKKRPIYWLFSSPKGSFNALIYLHRYRPDTASIVLQYLRDFRSKLVSERDHQAQMSISDSASQGEKTKALKKIEELKKTLVELDDYERETLYPLATQQVALDLDDGVKVNYLKLGAALKKIPGLEAKDDE